MSIASEIRPGQAAVDVRDAAGLVSRLFETHRHWIYRLCLSSLRSPQDAEDAVQHTFVNVFRAVERGATPRCESAWLAEIARNVCRERHRVAARRARSETIVSPDDLSDVPTRSSAPAIVDVDELDAALSRLEPRQRTALLLREWRGLSHNEIGGLLHLSQDASEALVSRARRSLVRTLRSGTRVGPCLNLVGLAAALRRWLVGGTAKAAAVAACGVTIVVAPTLEGTVAQPFAGPRAAPAERRPVTPTFEHLAQGPMTRRPAIDTSSRSGGRHNHATKGSKTGAASVADTAGPPSSTPATLPSSPPAAASGSIEVAAPPAATAADDSGTPTVGVSAEVTTAGSSVDATLDADGASVRTSTHVSDSGAGTSTTLDVPQLPGQGSATSGDAGADSGLNTETSAEATVDASATGSDASVAVHSPSADATVGLPTR